MIEPERAIILIVEDNADNMFLTMELLRSLGVQYVNGRASGRQLFRLIESSAGLQPDLILLDIQIPREDGYEILRQIRQHESLRDTRVVALTANVMPQDVERAQQAGFDGFIGKPINFKRFPDQIRRILAGQSVWEAR